ncbi:hypothetical protein KFE16_06260 [Clostridiaceae bacterium Marseille-Q4149]|jgi:hypothetical protein|nr:hypothetical protein KFE16_06260 [Clostridiaceae bacterium Marseille-Q4149]
MQQYNKDRQAKREPGVCRTPAFAKVYTTCRQSAFYANVAEQRFANCRSVARQNILPQKQKKVLNSQRIKHFSLVYGVRKRWICVFDRWIRTLEAFSLKKGISAPPYDSSHKAGRYV